LTDIHDVGPCRRKDVHRGDHGQESAPASPLVHFDLTETAVRGWVKQAERAAGTGTDSGLTTGEREELRELRRENRRLREDVGILKRATAFFATETR